MVENIVYYISLVIVILFLFFFGYRLRIILKDKFEIRIERNGKKQDSNEKDSNNISVDDNNFK